MGRPRLQGQNETRELEKGLIVLDQLAQLLARAETLEELTDLRSRAEALRHWAKGASMGLEAQNQAAELRLRAERKAGNVLASLNLRGGDRKSNGRHDRLNLNDLGISQSQSKRWQKQAAVPDSVFERYLQQTNQFGEEVTAAGLMRVIRKVAPLTARHRTKGNVVESSNGSPGPAKQSVDFSACHRNTDVYTWDARNRLTKVTRTAQSMPVWTVDYKYDHQNRLVQRIYTPAQGAAETETFVYDGNQVVARLDGSGAITNRYLWADAVDMLLADETVQNGLADVRWALGDHQNSVRDLVDFNPGAQTTTPLSHRIFDAFGKRLANNVSATNVNPSTVDSIFGWTGRYFDPATGLQNNLNRWYDPQLQQWLSPDPIGFTAGDPNTRRYTGNDPINRIDPDGLDEVVLRDKEVYWKYDVPRYLFTGFYAAVVGRLGIGGGVVARREDQARVAAR
jgi:RHS repeat-associated protein